MNIVLISSEPYQHNESPMLGVFQKDQFEALLSIGLKASVLSPAGRSLRYAFDKKTKGKVCEPNHIYRNNGFNLTPRFPFIEKSLFIYNGLKLFKNLVLVEGIPDVIHAHNALFAGELARIISKKWNVPYVITEHSSWVLKKHYQGNTKTLIERVYQNASQVIAVSSNLAKTISSEYFNGDIQVVPNIIPRSFCIDIGTILQNRDQLARTEFRIINVASLDSNKNQIGIIKAFAKFYQKVPKAKLILVGDGPAKGELLALIQELDMENCIVLLGHLTREDIIEQLYQSHLFVLGSFFETFGVVAIEANSIGLPVLSTPCGGVNDIIRDMFNGLIVKKNTCEDIYNGMNTIYSCFDDFDVKAMVEFTQEQYSSANVANQLVCIYKKTIT